MWNQLISSAVCITLLPVLIAEEVRLTVEPHSFRLNFDHFGGDEGHNKDFIKKGTTVSAVLTLKGDGKISKPGSKEFDSWFLSGLDTMPQVLLKDSNGKNMGEFIHFLSQGMAKDKEYKCLFSFKHYPSPKSEFLHLKGEMPVYIWIEPQVVDFNNMSFKEGAQATAYPFTMKIERIDRNHIKPDTPKEWAHQYSVGFRVSASEGNYDIKELAFTDVNGEEVKACSSGRGGYYIKSGDKDMSVREDYEFFDLPDVVNISVTYWTLKQVTVPIDLKFDLKPER